VTPGAYSIKPIHRHLPVVMPTLRAGDEVALAGPSGQELSCKVPQDEIKFAFASICVYFTCDSYTQEWGRHENKYCN
jgi:hypothetical protein